VLSGLAAWLAVVLLAELPAILTGDADRMLALLRKIQCRR